MIMLDKVLKKRIKTYKAQLRRDHQAMQIFRRHNGDLKLVSFVGGKWGQGYDCSIFQHSWVESHRDPSQAIINAYRRWRKEVLTKQQDGSKVGV
jgi:hypothetical protein